MKPQWKLRQLVLNLVFYPWVRFEWNEEKDHPTIGLCHNHGQDTKRPEGGE